MHPKTIELDAIQPHSDGQSTERNQESPNTLTQLQCSTEPEKPLQAIDNHAPVKKRSRVRLWAIVIALYLSTFVFALDATIIATSLPTIAHDLDAGDSYSWVGSSYLLAAAAAGPLWSNWSNIWGRKPAMTLTIAVFFLSSIVCALANSSGMLIAGRVLQGLGGGGINTLVYILISDIFSVRMRTLIFGLMEIVWATAAGAGPVLGGAITQNLSWRWIFWINLPISGVAFALTLLFLDVHNPRTRTWDGLRAIDWWGGLSVVGLTVLVLVGLNFGGTVFPWSSPTVICLLVFGAVMSVLFIASEKWLAAYPILPLNIYRDRSNAACLIATMAHSMVVLFADFYIPVYLQSVRGASPIESGVLLIPFDLSEAIMAFIVGVVMNRTGASVEVIWVSTFLMTVGAGTIIDYTADASLGKIIGYQLIAGFGSGGLFQPYLIAVQTSVQQDDQAAATAALGFVRMVAGALALIIGGVIFENGMLAQGPALLAAGLSSNTTAMFTGSDAVTNVAAIGALADPVQQSIVRQAYALSLRNVWIATAVVAGIALVSTAFIKKSVLSEEHSETITGLKKTPIVARGDVE